MLLLTRSNVAISKHPNTVKCSDKKTLWGLHINYVFSLHIKSATYTEWVAFSCLTPLKANCNVTFIRSQLTFVMHHSIQDGKFKMLNSYGA